MKIVLLLILFTLGVSFAFDRNKLLSYCTGVLGNECPKGSTLHYSGPNMLNAVCLCERPMTEQEIREDNEYQCEAFSKDCIRGNTYFCNHVSRLGCSTKVYVNLCEKTSYFDRFTCYDIRKQYADEKNREGVTDDMLKKCQDYKGYCLGGNSSFCPDALRNCDRRSIKQLCDANKVSDGTICEEVKKELDLIELKERDPRCEMYIIECQFGQDTDTCKEVVQSCGKTVTAELCNKRIIKNKTVCIAVKN